MYTVAATFRARLIANVDLSLFQICDIDKFNIPAYLSGKYLRNVKKDRNPQECGCFLCRADDLETINPKP